MIFSFDIEKSTASARNVGALETQLYFPCNAFYVQRIFRATYFPCNVGRAPWKLVPDCAVVQDEEARGLCHERRPRALDLGEP